MKYWKKANKISLLRMFLPYVFKVPLKFSFFGLKNFKNMNPFWVGDKLWINSLFPPYPSIAYNRFMDGIIEQKRLPLTTYVAVTSKCPYNCPFCSYGKRPTKELTTKQMINLIDQIKNLGTAVFGITGGEPLLRKDLEIIIKKCKPEMFTILFTTGYKLTPKRVSRLYSAGIDCVTIGLESYNSKKHDDIKGSKGSFIYGKKAIELFNKYEILTSIGTIGTKEKIKNGELEKIYNLAIEWNVDEIRLISPVATGNWLGKTEEMLGDDEYKFLRDFHISRNKSRMAPVLTWITFYESPEMFGCLTGNQYLFVDSSGDVCPCDVTPLSFGNIKDNSLEEIWKQMEVAFPKPRLRCIMNKIAPKIKSDKLPLSPEESYELINSINNEGLPEVSRLLKKK